MLKKYCDFMSLPDNGKLVLIVSSLQKELAKFISNAWKHHLCNLCIKYDAISQNICCNLGVTYKPVNKMYYMYV